MNSLRQGVVIGRHLFAEDGQARIAVALLHVAEHLVVGAVLLDDVDDVLEDRRLAVSSRHGHGLGVGVRFFQAGEAVGQAVVGVDLAGVASQLGLVGHVDDGYGAEVIVRVLALLDRPRLAQRAMSLDVGDEQLFAVGGDEDGAGIPAGRDQAGERLSAPACRPRRASACAEADDGDAVIGAVGDVQRAAVGAEGQGIRSRCRTAAVPRAGTTIVSTTSSAFVSRTETVSLLALAT